MAKSDAPNSSPSQASEPPPVGVAGPPAGKPGPAVAAPAASARGDDGAPPPSALPTYLTARSSRACDVSRRLLAGGHLEEALETVEMALEMGRRILEAGSGEGGDVDVELHESLGPLYYLYGTTLLYSVEESDAMMAAGAPAVGSTGSGGGEEGEPSSGPADVEVGSHEEGEVRPVVRRFFASFGAEATAFFPLRL